MLVKRVFGIAAIVGSMLGAAVSMASAQTFDEKFADLIAAAKKEGQVTWYNSALETGGRSFAKVFENRFGVRLNHSFMVGSPNLERFRAESRSGNHVADVFTMADSALMLEAINEKLIVPYKVDTYAKFSKDWMIETGEGIAYPTSRVQMALMFNTAVLSADEAMALSEWNSLLSPKFAGGKVGIADAARTGSTYSTYLYLMREAKDKYGADFMTKFAAQKPIVFNSHSELGSRVASGELDVGLVPDSVPVEHYNRGSPIGYVYPDPTPISPILSGVSANAPHPNAAKLLLEYMTSDEGMSEWGKLWGVGLGRPELDQTVPNKASKEPWYASPKSFYIPKDLNWALEQQQGVIHEWKAALGR